MPIVCAGTVKDAGRFAALRFKAAVGIAVSPKTLKNNDHNAGDASPVIPAEAGIHR